LVSTVPADDEAVSMTVLPDALALAPAAAGLAEDAGDDAAVLLPALLHAAASTATPTAPPTPAASLAGFGMRLIVEIFISSSCPVRRAAPVFLLRQMAVDRTTGGRVRRDWKQTGQEGVIRVTGCRAGGGRCQRGLRVDSV
jgi:hypothetical protein